MRTWKLLGIAGIVGAAAAGLAAARRRAPGRPEDQNAPAPAGRSGRGRHPSRGFGRLAVVGGAGTPGTNGDRRPRSERR